MGKREGNSVKHSTVDQENFIVKNFITGCINENKHDKLPIAIHMHTNVNV